jgi:hypothetical protein
MAYGSVLTDVVQSSVTGTPPQFNDGNGTQTGTLCRAWVNFNGTGTVAIRASFNVSSITDNGTGDYTVNFTNAMPDGNYAVATNGHREGDGSVGIREDQMSTTFCKVFNCQLASATKRDEAVICVSIFR